MIRLNKWQAKVVEDAVEPELEIVDPHHHLADPKNEPRGDISMVSKLVSCMGPTMREITITALYPKDALDAFGANTPMADLYLSEQLVNDFCGHNVQKSVAIEAAWEDHPKDKPRELWTVSESKKFYDDSVKDPNGFPHYCVAFMDLRLGKERISKAIEEHKKANPNLRGVRHQLAFDSRKGIYNARVAEHEMSKTSQFRSGMEALDEAGLTFDIYVYHPQLAEAAELVEAFPNVQFILDHCGTPVGVGPYAGKKGRELARKEWERDLPLLARYPNVAVKLSGMLMPVNGFDLHKQKSPPTSDQLVELTMPYYKYVVDTFGVDRCMFASNFPVDRVSCSYNVLYNSFKKMCNQMDLSAADKAKLFKTNAERIYRMNE